jgi:hypothetical protein
MSNETEMCLASDVLVWTKYGHDASERMEGIHARKEAERQKGSFWWGIGSSLHREKLQSALKESRGTLHVLFSEQRSPPKPCRPGDKMRIWTHYWDEGEKHEIPDHALVVSKGKSERYYALVCKSVDVITPVKQHFHEQLYQNYPDGKTPGNSQNTALLKKKPQGDQGKLRYKSGFVATLVSPYFVTLSGSRLLEPDEQAKVQKFRAGHDYNDLIQRIRTGTRQAKA